MKSSATWKMCWTVVQNDPSARLSKTNIFTVKGLFENPSELRKHRSRYDIYKRIEASYYGYRDDEDGVLEKVERGAEERMRAESVECQNHQNYLNSRFLLASFLLPCNVIWKFPENNLDVLKFPDKNRWWTCVVLFTITVKLVLFRNTTCSSFTRALKSLIISLHLVAVDRGGGECDGGCEDKSVCAWEDKILSAFMEVTGGGSTSRGAPMCIWRGYDFGIRMTQILRQQGAEKECTGSKLRKAQARVFGFCY
ncbi:pre-mRNA-splicing factor ISY1 [Tanacetum coccineum]